MYRSSVLLIDTDTIIIERLSQCFQREGAIVQTFHDALSAFDYLQKEKDTDVVVTNWTLPQLDGLELCKMIKRDAELSHIPVVMMADRDSEIDAVIALEVGAEDFVRKPLMVRELITRVKKIIQRQKSYNRHFSASNALAQAPKLHENEVLQHQGIKIDSYRHKAYWKDKEMNLTYSEFKLLELFLSHPGRVFQRSLIIEKISGIDYFATERSVDVMVVGLRKKLGKQKHILETVRGVGYRFNEKL